MSETVAVVRAARPNFLLLAPLCVGLGLAVAWRQGQPPALIDTLLVFVGAVLAHAAVNLLNEYEDFRSGLDLITRRTPFSGGSGALLEVPSAARRVLWAGLGTPVGDRHRRVLFVASGFAHVRSGCRWGGTGADLYPLDHPFAAVMPFGTGHWLWPGDGVGHPGSLGARLDAAALICAAVALLLVSELLLINQIPDADADRQVGRRHLVITLGPETASRIVAGLLAGSYLLIGAGILTGILPVAALIALLPLPLALWISVRLPHVLNKAGELNRLLGANVVTLLSTLALLMAGLSL